MGTTIKNSSTYEGVCLKSSVYLKEGVCLKRGLQLKGGTVSALRGVYLKEDVCLKEGVPLIRCLPYRQCLPNARYMYPP